MTEVICSECGQDYSWMRNNLAKAMDTQTPQQPHDHDWRDTGKREVRYCEACRATEIKSLADLHWHPYISGDQVTAQQQRIVALSDEKSKLTDSWMEVHNLAVKRAWRIEALEAALRKYARHLGNCEVFASFMVSEGQVGFDCSCGYDALPLPLGG